MPYYVRLPDNRDIEFPDNYPRDDAVRIARDIFRQPVPQQVAPAAPPEERSLLGGALSRGYNTLQSSLGSAAEGVGNVTGIESLRNYGAESRRRNALEAEQAQPADRRATFEDANSFGGYARATGQAVAESLPATGLGLAGGIAGGALGSLLGPAGTAVGAIGGRTLGAFLGSSLASLPTFYGSNRQRQIEESTPRDAEGRPTGEGRVSSEGAAFGAAVPQAAMEGITDVLLAGLGRFFRGGVEEVGKAFLPRVAQGIGVGAASEVPAEVLQQALERAQAGLDLQSPEAYREYREATIAAIAAGGTMGGAISGALGKRPAPVTAREQEDEELRQSLQVIAQQREAEAAAAQSQPTPVAPIDPALVVPNANEAPIDNGVMAKTAVAPAAPIAQEAPVQAAPEAAPVVPQAPITPPPAAPVEPSAAPVEPAMDMASMGAAMGQGIGDSLRQGLWLGYNENSGGMRNDPYVNAARFVSEARGFNMGREEFERFSLAFANAKGADARRDVAAQFQAEPAPIVEAQTQVLPPVPPAPIAPVQQIVTDEDRFPGITEILRADPAKVEWEITQTHGKTSGWNSLTEDEKGDVYYNLVGQAREFAKAPKAKKKAAPVAPAAPAAPVVTAPDPAKVAEAQRYVAEQIEAIRKTGAQGERIASALDAVVQDPAYHPLQTYGAFVAGNAMARVLPKNANHKIEFTKELIKPNLTKEEIDRAKASGIEGEGGAAGSRNAAEQIIEISLAPEALNQVRQTGAHEAFHVLQDYYAKYDPNFMKVANAAFTDDSTISTIDKSIRKKLENTNLPAGNKISEDGKYKTYWQALEGNLGDRKLSAREQQAYTYAALYDAARFGTPMTGLKPSMTRFINFLRDFFASVRNSLKGNGFNNVNDLFGRAVDQGGSRFNEDQILDVLKDVSTNIEFAAATGGGAKLKGSPPDVELYPGKIVMIWDVAEGGSIYMESFIKGNTVEVGSMFPIDYKKNPNIKKTKLPHPFNVKLEIGHSAARKTIKDLIRVVMQYAPNVDTVIAQRIGGARERLKKENQMMTMKVPKPGTKPVVNAAPSSGREFAAVANSVNMSLPEFKNWFGDSKVVDENRNPARVYTGSTVSNIREFDIKFASPESLFGRGFWFTDNPEVAGGVPKSATSLEDAYEKGTRSNAGYAFQGRRTVIEAPNAEQTEEIKTYLSEFGEIFLGEKNSSEFMNAINNSPEEFANKFNTTYQKAPRYNNNRSRLDTFSNYLKDQLGLEVRQAGEATVYPVYLSIKNPFDIYSTFENPYVDGRLQDEEGNLLNKDAVNYVWKHWYEMFSNRKDWDIDEYSKKFWRSLEIYFDQYGPSDRWREKPFLGKYRTPINKDLYDFLESEAEDINRNRGYDEHAKDTVNNALRRVGYDGIRTTSNDIPSRREEGPEKNKTTQPFVVWIAFDPKQIKSTFNKFAPGVESKREFAAVAKGATGGLPPVGTRLPPLTQAMANTTELNIEYNATAKALGKRFGQLGFKDAPKKVEGFFVAFQDRMLPLARIVDGVKKDGGNVTQAMNAYVEEDLMSGRTADMLEKRNKTLYQPMVNGVANSKISSDDFENYLYARHATERNVSMASINPKFPDGGSGMDSGTAKDMLKEFADAGKIPELERLAKFADAIVADTNKVYVESGLTPDFSKMTVDSEGRLLPNYQFYVPLKGFAEESVNADETINEFRPKNSKMLGAKGRENMRALGRKRMAGDIMAHLIMQNTQAVIRSQKNAVGQSFLAMLRANPKQTEGIAEVLSSPPLKSALVNGVVKTIPDPMYKGRPDILVVKEGGKEIAIQIKDEAVAKSMIGATANSPAANNALIKGMLAVNRFLSKINTAYNPEFIITNFVKDLQGFGVNVAQFDVKGLRADSIRDVIPAMAGIRDVVRDSNSNSEMARYYNRLKELGGTNELYGFADIDTRIKEINETMAKTGTQAKSWKDMAKVVAPVGKFLEDYNTVAENGIRTSLFKNLVERGINENQAAYIAKNVTVNFTKGGEHRVFMNAMYLFYNASLQGTMAMVNGMVRSPKVRKIVAGIVVAGVMQDALNSMLSGEDEDGEKIYDKIPDYILKRSFVMMDPFGLTERGYFSFPMPYGFNAFFNMGREMSKVSRGKSSPMDAAGNILGTFVDAFNPVGGANSWLNFVAPTILDPLVDLGQNTDFAGRLIVPERGSQGIQQPDSQKYWNNTFAPYVKISEFLNTLTGGTSVIPGQVDISPNTIQYLINYATGGVGKFVERSFNTATTTFPALLTGDLAEVDMRETPLLRSLYGNVTSRNDMERYMQRTQEVLQVRQEIRAANEVGDSERVAAAFERYPGQIEIMDSINKLARDRSKLTREINSISRNENIPDDVKRDLIKQLRDQQNQLVGLANRLYNQRVTNRG